MMDKSLINKVHNNIISINNILKYAKHNDLTISSLNMLKSTAYNIADILSSFDKTLDNLNSNIDQSYKSMLKSVSILNIQNEFSEKILPILDTTIPLLNKLKNMLRNISFEDLSASEFYSLWDLSESMANFLLLVNFVDITGEVDDIFRFAEEDYNFKFYAKDDEYIDNSDE